MGSSNSVADLIARVNEQWPGLLDRLAKLDAIPNSAADIGSGECGDCECWDDATCYQGHATRNRACGRRIDIAPSISQVCARDAGHEGACNAIPNRVRCENPLCIHADHPANRVRHTDQYGCSWTDAIPNSAAIPGAATGANPLTLDAIPNSVAEGVKPGTFGPVFDAGVEEGKRQVRHATRNRAAVLGELEQAMLGLTAAERRWLRNKLDG